jgi:hypothetical protein
MATFVMTSYLMGYISTGFYIFIVITNIHFFMKRFACAGIFLTISFFLMAQSYQPTWESIDKRQVPDGCLLPDRTGNECICQDRLEEE